MKLAAILLFLVAGAFGLRAAHQHYLPSVGPNPLRFHAPAPASLPLPEVPPLAAPPLTPEKPDAPVRAPVPAEPSAQLPTPEPPPTARPEQPAVPGPESSPPAEHATTLTPQMLLHYFRDVGGTNETAVALPVLFTPPLPAGSELSSRASYIVEPGPVAGPGTPQPSPP